MKSKEEIEQLAFLEYPRVINDPYNPMEDDNADERQIWINAYSKCQEDMANDINRKLDLLIGLCEKRISDCVVNKLNILEVDTQGMLFAYKTFKQYINKQH